MSNYEFWDELGKIFNAVVAYQEKSVEFNKRFINPWIRLGNVFDKQDRYREAIEAYQKAIELDPENAQNWCDLGNAYFRTKTYDQAVEAFKRAIELDPQLGWPYSNLALAYVTQDDHEQAVFLYQKSIELLEDEKDKAVSWNRLGNLYRKMNQYDLAVQAFQQADELDHENAGFRDELDEVPEPSALQNGTQEPEAVVPPIQLIVEEGQAEEAVASAEAIEAPAVAEPEEDLSSEASEEAPAVIDEVLPEQVAEMEPMQEPAEADPIEQAGPVQSEAELGRLPEELVVETTSQPEAVVETAPEPEAELKVAEETSAVIAEVVNEVVIESGDEPAPVEAEAPVEAVVESPVSVQAVVETYTESLMVNDTATKTTDVALAAAESQPEPAPEVEEALAPGLEPAIENTVEETPAVEANKPLPVGETEPVVEMIEPAPVVAEEVAPVAAVEEILPEPEVVAELVAEANEALQENGPKPAPVVEEAAPEIAADAVAADAPVVEEPVADAPVETSAEEVTAALASDQAAYEEYLKDEDAHLNVPENLPSAEPVTQIDEAGEFQMEMDTKNAHVWNELGNVYFNNGAVEDSVVAYSKAIELDRWFAWPYSNLALAYVQKGRFAEAVLLYQRSIELFTSEKDKAISWNRLGNVYRRMNDYENAIAAYQRADEMDPDNTTLSLQSRFSLLGSYQMEQNASYTA